MANGDIVKAGQLVGTVGSTANSTGNHVSLEVRRQHCCDMCPEEPCCKCSQRAATA